MNDGIGNSVQCNTRCHHGEDCPERHGQVDAGVALERVEQADEDEGDGADVEVGQEEPRLDKNEKLDVLFKILSRSAKRNKLGNVWICVQLFFSPGWSTNQLYKNPNIV